MPLIGHTGYISKQTVSGWIRHLITQDQLEGSRWGYSSPNPHQLPSKRAPSICLFLGVPPNYSLNRSWLGLLEEQQYHDMFVSFYLRDLSQMKDVTTTGPLWLANRSYPEDLTWNRFLIMVQKFGVMEIFQNYDNVMNRAMRFFLVSIDLHQQQHCKEIWIGFLWNILAT